MMGSMRRTLKSLNDFIDKPFVNKSDRLFAKKEVSEEVLG
jgi:hypothetical protein